MPIFRCSRCGCVENTATSSYWSQVGDHICSECETGKWHNLFHKVSAVGYLIGSDGFLYSKQSYEAGNLDFRITHQGFSIVGEVKEEKP